MRRWIDEVLGVVRVHVRVRVHGSVRKPCSGSRGRGREPRCYPRPTLLREKELRRIESRWIIAIEVFGVQLLVVDRIHDVDHAEAPCREIEASVYVTMYVAPVGQRRLSKRRDRCKATTSTMLIKRSDWR
jgi:hypothetical protein